MLKSDSQPLNSKTLIVIQGPTAVGKTSLAIHVAKDFETSIISSDSRQCYREMTIGTAKPAPIELKQVKHYFINSHSITDELNAAAFEKYANEALKEIFSSSDVAVMAGGTGLYGKAFLEGMDDIPPVQPGIREEILENYGRLGLSWLQDEVREKDPVYSIDGEMKNPHRLIRALEVKISTGRSIRSFQLNKKKLHPFRIVKFGIQLPKDILEKRIYERVDKMIEDGLLEEIQSLYDYRELPALQTVGYSELFEYLDKKISLDEAAARIRHNTKQYAKRQMTWFRKDPEITWINPGEKELILKSIYG